MNFYFCETCGKRITEIDLQQGQGRNKKLKGYYCRDCAAGVQTMELPALNDAEAREFLAAPEAPSPKPRITPSRGLTPRVPTSRIISSRREAPEQSATAPTGKNNRAMIISGVAVAVLLLVAAAWMVMRPSSSPTQAAAVSEARPNPPLQTTPVTVVRSDALKITKAPELSQNPAPVQTHTFLTGGGGDDIRDEVARRRFDEIAALENSGKATPEQLSARYNELATSSFRTTKAGQEAIEKLKTLPPPPAKVERATGETKSSATGIGIWWEGENAVETDFVSHIWMAEQGLDYSKISAGKYLNHLNDATWLKLKGKSIAKSLFARYVIDVPADATYTLWVREYDPYSAGPWKFKWDEEKWFEVPPNQPYQDRVEIGKDRPLVWRNYPNQTLTKGKHSFRLEVNLERHGISAFDCFYLTTDTFKPDAAKKP